MPKADCSAPPSLTMNKRTDESSVKVSEPRLAGLKLEILT